MSACSKQSRPTAPKGGSPFAPTNSPTVSDRTPLANSPDWLKAAPMWENLLASWRQSGQKKYYCPSLLNHNAKYKRFLTPCCDFANGVGHQVGRRASPVLRYGWAHRELPDWRVPRLCQPL